MDILATQHTTDSVVIIIGKSEQATAIAQILQLSQSLPVIAHMDACWIDKFQKNDLIELLFIPYGCECRNCPLDKENVKIKLNVLHSTMYQMTK
jgi:hypothetical protein